MVRKKGAKNSDSDDAGLFIPPSLSPSQMERRQRETWNQCVGQHLLQSWTADFVLSFLMERWHQLSLCWLRGRNVCSLQLQVLTCNDPKHSNKSSVVPQLPPHDRERTIHIMSTLLCIQEILVIIFGNPPAQLEGADRLGEQAGFVSRSRGLWWDDKGTLWSRLPGFSAFLKPRGRLGQNFFSILLTTSRSSWTISPGDPSSSHLPQFPPLTNPVC